MLRYRIKSLIFISLLFTLFVTPAAGEVINRVAAIVNDTIITTYQLDQKATEAAAQDPQYSNLDAAGQQTFKKKVLELMIEEELITQRAKELNISVSDDEINASIDDVQAQNKLTRLQLIAALEQQGMSFDSYSSNMRSQITRYKLIAKEVQNKIDVTGQETRRYYEQHSAEYLDAPYVHLSRLTFPLPEGASAGKIATAQAQAEKAHSRLLSGDSVADLLVTYSEASGGGMGKIRESNLATEFAAAVAPLKSGEVSDIIKTSDGLFLFKMEERNSGSPKPLEAVQPEIEKILMEKSRDDAFKTWKESLRSSAYIDIRI